MKKTAKVKTNAARMLDRLNISYELREYEVDEEDLSATHVAERIAMPARQVFKTLVVRGDKTGVLLASIPAPAELDLKRLAEVSGNKRVELVPTREIFSLTGYIRGGVSPLGTKKSYPFILDSSAREWPVISVSAGMRGCQLVLAPEALASAAGAAEHPISR